MGRESRRKRLAGPLDNRGDLDRAEVAIGTLLTCFKADPRIGAQYEAWCHGRELPRLMTVPVSDHPEMADLKAAAWTDLMAAVMRAPSDAEQTAVRQVLDTMGPDRTWPRAAATHAIVSRLFPAIFYRAIAQPELQLPLWVTVRDDGAVRLTYGPDEPPLGGRWVMTRRGHRPQQTGHAKVKAAVETWYQAYLQPEPVPIPVLTQKYAAEAERRSEAHSVVYDRIELAETLLNKWLEA